MNNHPPTPIRVAVVEADALIRQGLVSTLETAQFAVVAAAASVGDLPDEPDFDVLVLELPDNLDVVEHQTSAGDEPVVVLVDKITDVDLADVLRAEVRSVLHKRVATRMLTFAVTAVTGGGVFLEPSIVDRLLAFIGRGQRGTGPHGLTAQERRVLSLLPGNPTNREIAEHLGISVETVKTHLRNAIRKLGAYDRFDAARMVEEHGIDNL